MAGKIFISYRRDDAAGHALGIRDRLAARFGARKVFMDVDDLLPGERFNEKLAQALSASDILIAVIGLRWTELLAAKTARRERDYVRFEIAEALKRRIVVIPVRVGREGQMPVLPSPEALPEDIRDLVSHQKHDVAHERFGRDIEDLAQSIIEVRRRHRRRGSVLPWRWLAAIAVGVVAVLAVAVYVPPQAPRPDPAKVASERPNIVMEPPKPAAAPRPLTPPAWTQRQGYPSKKIVQIVAFAAGGPSDALGRLLADHVSRQFGQQIVVENVRGASGTVGMERAAKAASDGYTVFAHHGGLAAAPALYANLKIDPTTAFEPVGLINTGPMVMLSRKMLETTTLKELAGWAKERGEKATIGFAGVGSNSYTCAMVFQQQIGAKLAMVAYMGTTPAMQDLVASRIDLLCDQATTAMPQIKAGTVKAYTVTSAQRLPSLPDVPSNVEAGLPGLNYTIWNGAYVPKGTPKQVIDRWNEALGKFVSDPKIVERFEATGTVPFPPEMRSPAAHAKFLNEQLDFYAKLFAEARLKKAEVK